MLKWPLVERCNSYRLFPLVWPEAAFDLYRLWNLIHFVLRNIHSSGQWIKGLWSHHLGLLKCFPEGSGGACWLPFHCPCLLPTEAPSSTSSAPLPCLGGRCPEKNLLLTLPASPLGTKQWLARCVHTDVMGIWGERGGKAESRQGNTMTLLQRQYLSMTLLSSPNTTEVQWLWKLHVTTIWWDLESSINNNNSVLLPGRNDSFTPYPQRQLFCKIHSHTNIKSSLKCCVVVILSA